MAHAHHEPGAQSEPTEAYCHDEVTEQVHLWTLDLRCIATELETIGPLWRDWARRLTDVTCDLEELVAGLRGQSRYRVVFEHPAVFAVDEQEAIERAERCGGPATELHTRVEEAPLTRPRKPVTRESDPSKEGTQREPREPL